LVPHSAVVAGDHAEAIVTRWEVAVERPPPVAGVLPVAIPAFQLVTKEDLLGRDQAWRGVVDLEVPNESGQGHVRTGTSRGVNLPVGDDLLDMHRRGKLVEREVPWVEGADAMPRQKPQLPVPRPGDQRGVATGTGMAHYAIRDIEQRGVDLLLRAPVRARPI